MDSIESKEDAFQQEPSFKEELDDTMARAMVNRDTIEILRDHGFREIVNEAMARAMISRETLEIFRDHAKMQVVDEESARQALSCSLQARKIKNNVEQSRKDIVRPYIDFKKAVMMLTKDIYEGFEQLERDFQLKVYEWMDSQKENPFTRIDEIKVEDGSINLKTITTFQIIDEDDVPCEFMSVDDKKIKDAIAKGRRHIPGIEIITREVAMLRVKN